MRNYTYGQKEIELIQHLLNFPPKKIWWNFVWYIFDYSDFYIKLECVSETADTQNKSDEAIIGELTKIEEVFEPSENTEIVCENKPIDNAYIVRTFLYFTTYREFSWLDKLSKRATYKLKSVFTGSDPIENILSQTIGGCEEIICHPKSDQANDVNTKYANILDAGLLLEMEGKCIRAYAQNNGYGFPIWDDKYFFEPDELKEDAQLYEFIKVENSTEVKEL